MKPKSLDDFTAGLEEYDYETDMKKFNHKDFALEYNNIPYQSNVAIISTSHIDHLALLKSTLTSFRKSRKFVICAYDNPFNPMLEHPRKNKIILPTPDIWLLAHSWVFKHITYCNPKRFGWFWDLKYAFGVIDQFEFDYVFMNNGDCIWERPEGVDQLIDILGDGDFISSSSQEGRAPHTCSVIYKIDALRKIVDYMSGLMKIPTFNAYSAEVMLQGAIDKHKLKEVYAPVQPLHANGNVDYYHCDKQDCTWKDILGFRNLGAERVNWYKHGYGDRPPHEYTDLRFASKYEIDYAESLGGV